LFDGHHDLHQTDEKRATHQPSAARVRIRKDITMKNNPVGWFEIYVQDIDRAKRFYEAVFQLKLEKLNSPVIQMWAFPGNMNSSGAGGALVKMQDVSSGGNSILVYFSCEDCSIEESRAAESGGRIHRAKTPIGQYGFVSLIYDTEGNMLGLHSMK